jgi:Holliday junction resolvasome RuvABC endonuclease subunit
VKILGIDHGRNSGYALIENGKYVESGKFTVGGQLVGEMFKSFDDKSFELLQYYKPDLLCVEKPNDRTNGLTTMVLIGYYTTLLKHAFSLNIEELELHPTSVKKVVTGNGFADKRMVAEKLSIIHSIPFESIAIPVYYKKTCNIKGAHHKAGDVRHYVYDPSDALALATVGAKIKGEII